MRIARLSILALIWSPLAAQAPPSKPASSQSGVPLSLADPVPPQAAVPVSDEPHHAHEFQNGYVRVYNVTVAPLDTTLLHQHDLPYLSLSLGPADVVNAVQGQPEVHMTLEDGATRYSPGGFAHIVRTDAGVPFHNITIELVHPPGTPLNLGAQAKDRPLGSCPPLAADPRNPQFPGEQVVRCFETDEAELDFVRVEGGRDYQDTAPKTAALLVAMSDADLEVFLGGEHAGFLHAGDVLWLPTGTSRRITDFLGIRSNFLLLSFKDSGLNPPK